jgi:molecular chaperone DnaK
MAGRLAIDFGTSNTILALWDEQTQQGVPMHIQEYGKKQIQKGEHISVIPSVIHYADDNRRWIGQQVISRGLYNTRRTFRWMKQYINHRSPMRLRIDDRDITPFQAGQEFLSAILTIAGQEIGLSDEEVAFSAPVEAFEHYENWLSQIAESAGIQRFRIIDEPSAAALGYGAHIQPGNVYLIFDFGGGTLHASVILIESEVHALMGQRCRVLGKAGKSLGGSRIDQWLYQYILTKNNLKESNEEVRLISTQLLVECEALKEALSDHNDAEIQPLHLANGNQITARLTRTEFEEILDTNNLYTEISATIRSALNDARERGYTEDQIQEVLMVGGSSQIPSIQRQIRQIFGRDKVHSNRPLDAVARGAAAFVAGVDFYDHIQHDYAIRFVNPQIGSYDYRPIVKRGTSYPTDQPVAKLSIKASYDGQERLGLAIYEIGERRRQIDQSNIELVFDPAGVARLVQVTPQEMEDRTYYYLNENTPTFLIANPPAIKGEPRFEVDFHIDCNKRLTVTARDTQNRQLLLENAPVVRLT